MARLHSSLHPFVSLFVLMVVLMLATDKRVCDLLQSEIYISALFRTAFLTMTLLEQ